jgi:hypothetical protein
MLGCVYVWMRKVSVEFRRSGRFVDRGQMGVGLAGEAEMKMRCPCIGLGLFGLLVICVGELACEEDELALTGRNPIEEI